LFFRGLHEKECRGTKGNKTENRSAKAAERKGASKISRLTKRIGWMWVYPLAGRLFSEKETAGGRTTEMEEKVTVSS